MTKADLAGRLVDKGIFEARSKAVDAFLDVMADALKRQESAGLPGFGTFSVVERAARKGRNVRTGEEIDIPAKKAVTFKPAKALKDAVRGR